VRSPTVIVAALCALLGLVGEIEWLILLASVLLGAGVVFADVRNRQGRGVSAMTFFALAVMVGGIGDWQVVAGVARGRLSLQKYGLPRYYLAALFLNFGGAVFLLLGGWWAEHLCRKQGRSLLPSIDYRPRDSRVVVTRAAILGFGSAFLIQFGLVPRLGKLTNVFGMLPTMAVLLLARWGYAHRNKRATVLGFGLASYASTMALLYSFLRQAMVLPWVAFAVGAWAGRRHRSTFSSLPFVLMYAFGALFLAYFAVLGSVRQEHVYGLDRIPRLVERRRAQLEEEQVKSGQSALARLANVNKLSQILNLVDRNGLYMGQSLSYYAYVFIPRFIWRNKPIVKRGGWFAHEIGKGADHGAGAGSARYSNAINMTIPGELYLNFGLLGAVVGCLGVGFLVMLFWESTLFWKSTDNIAGNLMAFAIVKRCLEFMGPDMQAMVGHIATYLVFLGASHAARTVFAAPRRQRLMVGGQFIRPAPRPALGRLPPPTSNHQPIAGSQ
jgi:hypothetical protein